jgi:Mn2+/Fe2+ NRAMP family transporter
MAVFLLTVSNRRPLLGVYRNGPLANLLGGAVALVVTALAFFGLLDPGGATHGWRWAAPPLAARAVLT